MKLVRCLETGEEINEDDAFSSSYYASPFDTEPTEVHFSTEKMRDEYEESDFATCDYCNRTVVTENGYMRQVRYTEDGEAICLKCDQERAIEDGDRVNAFFFDTDDLTEAGYVLDQSVLVGNGRIERGMSKSDFNLMLKKTYLENIKVLINLDSMSTMGDGAYVDIYVKK